MLSDKSSITIFGIGFVRLFTVCKKIIFCKGNFCSYIGGQYQCMNIDDVIWYLYLAGVVQFHSNK